MEKRKYSKGVGGRGSEKAWPGKLKERIREQGLGVPITGFIRGLRNSNKAWGYITTSIKSPILWACMK